MAEERTSALNKAIDEINKALGADTIQSLENAPKLDVERISSGSMKVDAAIGGGWPLGRIFEIYGEESCGKSTLAIHAVAEFQKAGYTAAYIDSEFSFDKDYARNLGVDTEKLLFCQPNCGEDALTIVEKLARSGAVSLIVVDSVATLTPRAEIEGEVGEQKVGLQARMMSQFLRKIAGGSSQNKCSIIFINQTRNKIGVMYGSPITTTGGVALKFYSSIRIEMHKSTVQKQGDEATGNLVKGKIVKNKTYAPYRVFESEIVYGLGFDKASEVLDICVELNIIKKSGSWFNYGETRLGQGGQNIKALLRDNLELMSELEAKVKEKMEE